MKRRQLASLMTVIFLLEHLMAEQRHSPHASRGHTSLDFVLSECGTNSSPKNVIVASPWLVLLLY